MSDILSAQEAVELVLGGGCRGQIGSLIAQECYYDYDAGSIRPFMTDQWGGVAVDVFSLSPSPQFIYGSLSEPYYKCESGKEFEYDGHNIAGVSVALQGVQDQGQEYGMGARMIVYAFDENNNLVTSNGVTLGLDFLVDPYIAHPDQNLYIDWIAGYDDNNGQWFITPTIGYVTENNKLGSISPALFAGNSFVHAVETWGAGQQPIEDDGVTPTGGSGGGGGTYSRPDEEIAVPSLPSIDIAGLGIASIYHVSSANVSDLSAFLWSINFTDQILKNFASPLENISSLAIIPSISLNEASAEIIIGNLPSGVASKKLLTTFYEIDCGSINVNEYYKNFADYMTQIQIFLPFIGIREIPVDDCMSGYINVKYHVDVFSGVCVAYVSTKVGKGAWHVVQSHNGNISCQIPLSGANYAQVFTTAVSGITSAVARDPVGVFNATMNMKPEYQRAGNIGSFAGLMSVRYPYLIFTTPQIFTPEGFKDNIGYMSNLSGKISTFSGYLQVDTGKLDLTNLVITDDEREMLYQMLDDGIYI